MKPKLGAIGRSAPHIDVHIIDLDGEDCSVGQVGEICIKTEYETRPVGVCHSYNRSVEDTEAVYNGGFFHTGDTAYKDESGYIHYVGRNDDIIKSSGYRIGPFEIESVLIEHPAVLEVAVTGVPDPVRGFNVKATIVLQKGYEGSDELVRELQNYVKKNTAPYKYPRVVEFVEALPKTTSGKVRRAEIRMRDMEKYLKSQQNV
jgi:acetyl-CoA synthetase